MDINEGTKTNQPRILPAFISGFNTTASHIHLIILPVIIDLLIWFGPHFSLEKFFMPILDSLRELPGLQAEEFTATVQTTLSQLTELIKQFNLSVILRTYPVGIPSLAALISPLQNPIGEPLSVSLGSPMSVYLALFAFALVGLLLASVYYHQIAGKVHQEPKRLSFSDFSKGTFQIFLLPFFMILIMIMISIPLMLIIPVINFISPMIGQVALYIALLVILWLLVPLAFTPQAIFLLKQNVMNSMMTSISVIRYTLPGSAFFLLSAFILTNGMNLLWSIPGDNSWMLLVGILGHAFISTAVIASSYHYFLDATQYTQSMLIDRQSKLPSNPL